MTATNYFLKVTGYFQANIIEHFNLIQKFLKICTYIAIYVALLIVCSDLIRVHRFNGNLRKIFIEFLSKKKMIIPLN